MATTDYSKMRQKGGRASRDISIQETFTTENGDEYEPLYRHPADEQLELISWTPTALKIKERIEEVIEQKLNHALIQYYRADRDKEQDELAFSSQRISLTLRKAALFRDRRFIGSFCI
jgi:hypothetical protein